MKRILIIGISATGKTQLANHLHDRTGLPVVHLDSIFWQDNWQEQDQDIVESQINAELAKDEWIIEGYVEPLGKQRLDRADLVLYLDCPGRTALLGGIQRWFKYRGTNRPEMPSGNTESLGLKFLFTLLQRDERTEIENVINDYKDKVIRIKSRRLLKRYLSNQNFII